MLESKKLYTLGKNERLKSRKLIEQLFKKGISFSIFPLRVVYLQTGYNADAIKVGFTVSTKYFKKAVDRNRIKRQMKEAYRLQKKELKDQLLTQQKTLVLFFMYVGNELPEYPLITDKMKIALNKLKTAANAMDQKNM